MFKRKLHFLGETVTFSPLHILILVVIILRVPSLFEPYWYGDEGIYLAVGEGIRQGLLLYRDIFDHKPPLIYLLAAASGSLFWFKFMLLVWHLTAVVFFWKLAEKLAGQGLAPAKNRGVFTVLATAIFVVLTTLPTLEGNIANAELFMAAPTLIALYLFFRLEKPKILTLLSVGVLLSFAFLFKVPAVFDTLALLFFWSVGSLWNFKKIGQLVKDVCILGVGFFIPVAISIAYFWSQEALTQYLQAGLSQNISYIANWSIPNLGGSGTIKGGLTFRAEILAFVALALVVFKKLFDKPVLFAIIWLCFTTFAMLLSGRPYPHYIIQAVPALSLVVSTLALGFPKQRFLTVPFLVIFTASLVFYKFYYYPTLTYYQNFLSFVAKHESKEEYFKRFDAGTPTTYKLAKTIVSRSTPQDRLFIWGTKPELYALSRHLPPGRYVTSFHIVDFKGETETMTALRNNPPAFVVALREEPRNLPGFNEFLQNNYLFMEIIDNAEIWKLSSAQKNLKI